MPPHVPKDAPDLRRQLTAAANQSSCHDHTALDRLLEENYDELRHIAHALIAREAPGHSVEATGLVHLAYERLIDESHITKQGSLFFRAAFARTAQRILVERARARRAEKRGGARHKTELKSEHLQAAGTFDLVAFHDALTSLAELPDTGPRLARVVELRVFAGMTVSECAEALDVSPRTIDADWKIGRAFLQRQLAS